MADFTSSASLLITALQTFFHGTLPICSFLNLCALAAILMHVNAHSLSFIGRGRSMEETEFSSLPWVSLHCRARP